MFWFVTWFIEKISGVCRSLFTGIKLAKYFEYLFDSEV
uniref:Uncharacterized protein n=1 Tax=Anguilla anguilla TaxID=7936 RepID=A0A0E9QDE2_ANGAN